MIKKFEDIGRVKQVSAGIKLSRAPIDLLRTLIFTVADQCSRKCNYCPYGNGYASPFKDKMMHMHTFEAICNHIPATFSGTLSFSGFGEPTLNESLLEILHLASQRFKDAAVRLITNGRDLMILNDLSDCQNLVVEVSMHEKLDDNQVSFLQALSMPIFLRDVQHDIKFFNNRAGNVAIAIEDCSDFTRRCCSYPFYQMSVDINGDVLLCQSDWRRECILGNLAKQDMKTIWTSEVYTKIRQQLLKEGRSGLLCQKCSANGLVAGKEAIEMWRKIYEDS